MWRLSWILKGWRSQLLGLLVEGRRIRRRWDVLLLPCHMLVLFSIPSLVLYLDPHLVLRFLGLQHQLLVFLSTCNPMSLSKCSHNVCQSLTLK